MYINNTVPVIGPHIDRFHAVADMNSSLCIFPVICQRFFCSSVLLGRFALQNAGVVVDLAGRWSRFVMGLGSY